MRIDAHQHFWDPARFPYPWMPAEPSPLRRPFLPNSLAPILTEHRFDGTVLMQAATVAEEADWLLDLAASHEFILGVVAWVDLTDPNLGHMLDQLQRRPKFKGVRHPVHDEKDDEWLFNKDVLQGLDELARRKLPYDLLLFPRHLPLIPRLADSVPDLQMIIDHLAKPPIASSEIADWAEDLARAAEIPQVTCKISGMITEADHRNWKSDHLRPYVQHALACFGPDRLMFGSDWPVCLLAGSWKQVLAAFTQALGAMPLEARSKILGETAARVYRLSPPPPS